MAKKKKPTKSATVGDMPVTPADVVRQLFAGSRDTEPGEQINTPAAWKFNLKFGTDILSYLTALYGFGAYGQHAQNMQILFTQANNQLSAVNKALLNVVGPVDKALDTQMHRHSDVAVTSLYSIFPESDAFLTIMAQGLAGIYGGEPKAYKAALTSVLKKNKK